LPTSFNAIPSITKRREPGSVRNEAGGSLSPTLSIFPERLHIGDRFTDAETGDEPHEWEVASRPVTFQERARGPGVARR